MWKWRVLRPGGPLRGILGTRFSAGWRGNGKKRFRGGGRSWGKIASARRHGTSLKLMPMKSTKVKVMPPKGQEIASLVSEMISRLGEDPQRDGLQRTPERVDKSMRFLMSGYQMDAAKILNGALYEVKYDEMVV